MLEDGLKKLEKSLDEKAEKILAKKTKYLNELIAMIEPFFNNHSKSVFEFDLIANTIIKDHPPPSFSTDVPLASTEIEVMNEVWEMLKNSLREFVISQSEKFNYDSEKDIATRK